MRANIKQYKDWYISVCCDASYDSDLHIAGIWAHVSVIDEFYEDTSVLQTHVHEGFAVAGAVVKADSSESAEIQAIGLAVDLLTRAELDIKRRQRPFKSARRIVIYNDNQQAVFHWMNDCNKQAVRKNYEILWMSRNNEWFERYAHLGARSMRPPPNFTLISGLSLETMD